ncbi:ABC-2 transporter permease [Spiroplasma culicicola]|uniref:Uncharacterized protein n=1 Tax=Spiroplasma culicicola AES-1 TaxID=1276246 RepID=W6AFJ3_9MOLU|nr:hypothetical protein [Spiroplasma culicicola]AHI52459.1 hypothetical protein SCULI_v1c01180 [Spiroplasma culicicola AES-1]
MKLKLDKRKANVEKQASANFTIIFNINLKMALKNAGILVTKLVYIFAMIMILTFEVSSAIKPQDVDSLATFKLIFYIFSTILTVFYTMVITIYLLKKQWSDGIHSIESRAGFKPWKSYLIRALVQFTVMSISNAIILFYCIVLQFISAANTEIYFAYVYSQMFFLVFLSVVVTLMLLVIFAVCNTLVGTMLSTVLMFFMAFSPLFASIKSLLSGDSSIDYGLKMNAIDAFTRSTLSDGNVKVNSLYKDQLNNDQSIYLTQFKDNLEGLSETLSEEIDIKYLGLSQIPLEARTMVEYYDLNNGDINAQWVVWKDMTYKLLSTGQYGYENYVEGDNLPKEKFILNKLPIADILEDLLVAVIENSTQFKNENDGIVPALFIESYSWNYTPEVIQIDNFISQLKKVKPEYSNFLTNINKIYNKMSVVLNADSTQIFSNTQRTHSSDTPIAHELYTSDISYSQNDIQSRNICDEIGIECNQEILDRNEAVAETYNSFPELSIINYLIINLWFDSFALDSEIDTLYQYYNNSQAAKDLTTDVFKHFGVMSTGIFANPLINDSFNSSSFAPIKQGNTTSVKNILDYEKYTPDNLEAYALQEPYIIKEKLKYTNAFIIPLAYFVYLLVCSPLAYIGYWFYERKTKI